MTTGYWQSTVYCVIYASSEKGKNTQTITGTATGQTPFEAYSNALLSIFPATPPPIQEVSYTVSSINLYFPDSIETISNEKIIQNVEKTEINLSGYWQTSKQYSANFILSNGESTSYSASSTATGNNFGDADGASFADIFSQIPIPPNTISYSDSLSSVSYYFFQ